MTRTRNLRCLGCGRNNTEATAAAPCQRTHPKVGSVLICYSCGHIALATETGLREPTERERQSLLADPRIVRLLFGIRTRWWSAR